MNKKVFSISRDGHALHVGLSGDIKDSNTIILQNGSIDIKVNDIIVEALPNKSVNEYLVINPVHYSNMSIDGYFAVVVKKLGILDNNTPNSQVFTVSGPNARVNIHSTDNSMNVITQENLALLNKLDEITKELEKMNLESNKMQEALETVDLIRDEISSGRKRKALIEKLFKILPSTAAILKIIEFFKDKIN